LLLGYLTLSVVYQLVLAVAYVILKEPPSGASEPINCFAIVVPAHNEELLISLLCNNLSHLNYPNDHYEVFVIADNCTDSTVEMCAGYPVNVLCRNDQDRVGKGYALEWAFQQIPLSNFEAVFVIDADTTVHNNVLNELNKMLNAGEAAIQCYINVPNRQESWFTQLIAVSRTINNLLYHSAKYKLGLSAYLMGTGMCFSTKLMDEHSWNAFTLSEDWEYYANLISFGKKVAFASRAVVFQQESRSIKQATTQRLRWASGRFLIIKRLAFDLFLKGIRYRNYSMSDASLALIFPNWSLQINLILVALVSSFFLPASLFRSISFGLAVSLLCAQAAILLAGVCLAGDYWRVFKAILVSPIFLAWKLVIDLLCVSGMYHGKTWIRTKRHVSKIYEKNTDKIL